MMKTGMHKLQIYDENGHAKNRCMILLGLWWHNRQRSDSDIPSDSKKSLVSSFESKAL